jgi:aryl-alcohol dehydrogenase-like predicted oxidoreductase
MIMQMLGSMSKESSWTLLDAYFEAGGNFIDTAVSTDIA